MRLDTYPTAPAQGLGGGGGVSLDNYPAVAPRPSFIPRPSGLDAVVLNVMAQDPAMRQKWSDVNVMLNDGTAVPVADYLDRLVKFNRIPSQTAEHFQGVADMAGLGMPTLGDPRYSGYAGQQQAYDWVNQRAGDIARGAIDPRGREWASALANVITSSGSPIALPHITRNDPGYVEDIGSGLQWLTEQAHAKPSEYLDSLYRGLGRTPGQVGNPIIDSALDAAAPGVGSALRSSDMLVAMGRSEDPTVKRVRNFVEGLGDLAGYMVPVVGQGKIWADTIGAGERVANATMNPEVGFAPGVGRELGNLVSAVNFLEGDGNFADTWEQRGLKLLGAALLLVGANHGATGLKDYVKAWREGGVTEGPLASVSPAMDGYVTELMRRVPGLSWIDSESGRPTADWAKTKAGLAEAQRHAVEVATDLVDEMKPAAQPTETYPRQATWMNAGADEPVTVTGLAGEQGGVKYYRVEGSDTGIPETQIRFDEGPQGRRHVTPEIDNDLLHRPYDGMPETDLRYRELIAERAKAAEERLASDHGLSADMGDTADPWITSRQMFVDQAAEHFRMAPEYADALGAGYEQLMETVGAALGISAEEAMRRYPLQIRGSMEDAPVVWSVRSIAPEVARAATTAGPDVFVRKGTAVTGDEPGRAAVLEAIDAKRDVFDPQASAIAARLPMTPERVAAYQAMRWAALGEKGDQVMVGTLHGPEGKSQYVAYLRDGKVLAVDAGQADTAMGPESTRRLFEGPNPAGGKAAIDLMENNKSIIYALEAPDETSLLHELGHYAARILDTAPILTDAERLALDKAVGATPGRAWTEKPHETFVKHWVNYWREGKAPTPALERAFAKMADYIRGLLGKITQRESLAIKPAVRVAIEKMLGSGIDELRRRVSPEEAAFELRDAEDFGRRQELAQIDPEDPRLQKFLEDGTKNPKFDEDLETEIISTLGQGNGEWRSASQILEDNVFAQEILDQAGDWMADDGKRLFQKNDDKPSYIIDKNTRQTDPKGVAPPDAIVDFVRNPVVEGTTNPAIRVAYGHSEKLLKAAAEAGIDLSGSLSHGIDAEHIRHVDKNHGSTNKGRAAGEPDVVPEDYALVPQILTSPDSVVLSDQRGRQGEPRFVYSKNIGGTVYYIEQVNGPKTGMRMVSMWKGPIPKGEPGLSGFDTGAVAPSRDTSATAPGSDGIVDQGGQEPKRLFHRTDVTQEQISQFADEAVKLLSKPGKQDRLQYLRKAAEHARSDRPKFDAMVNFVREEFDLTHHQAAMVVYRLRSHQIWPGVAKIAARLGTATELRRYVDRELADMPAIQREAALRWALTSQGFPLPAEIARATAQVAPSYARQIMASGRPSADWMAYAMDELHLEANAAKRAVSVAQELSAWADVARLRSAGEGLKAIQDMLATQHPDIRPERYATVISDALKGNGLPTFQELRDQWRRFSRADFEGSVSYDLADTLLGRLQNGLARSDAARWLENQYGLSEWESRVVIGRAEERLAGRAIAETFVKSNASYKAVTDMLERDYPNIKPRRYRRVVSDALDEAGMPQAKEFREVTDPNTNDTYYVQGRMIVQGQSVTIPAEVASAFHGADLRLPTMKSLTDEARFLERATEWNPIVYDTFVRARQIAAHKVATRWQEIRHGLAELMPREWLRDRTFQEAVFHMADKGITDLASAPVTERVAFWDKSVPRPEVSTNAALEMSPLEKLVGHFQPRERVTTFGELYKGKVPIEKLQEYATAQVEYMAKQYDVMLNDLNAVMREHGMPEVPRRSNYMTHVVDSVHSLWETASDLLFATGDYRRHNRWFEADAKPRLGEGGRNAPGNAFTKQRKGVAARPHAAANFETYVPVTLAQTHFTRPVIQRKALVSSLVRNEMMRGVDDVVQYMKTQASVLAGEKHPLEAAMENTIASKKLTRWMLPVYDAVFGRLSANKVLANVKVGLLNAHRLPMIAQRVGYQRLARAGMVRTAVAAGQFADPIAASPWFKKWEANSGPVNESVFLGTRYAETTPLTQSPLQDWAHKALMFDHWAERQSLELAWTAYHMEAVERGNGVNPVEYADKMTAKLAPDRSRGGAAPLFRTRAGRSLLQFQQETVNFYRFLEHDARWNELEGRPTTPQEKMRQAARLWFGMYVVSTALRAMTGDASAPDMVNALIEAGQIAADPDAPDEEKIWRVPARILGEATMILPGASTVTSWLPGTPEQHKFMFGDIDTTRFKGVPANAQTLRNLGDQAARGDMGAFTFSLLTDGLLPFGGGQLRKTVKGAQAVAEGGVYDRNGKLMYSVDDPLNAVRAVAFGPYATDGAREYGDQQMKTIESRARR